MTQPVIGGYFGLELRHMNSFPHSCAILVNSGRNALEFILRTLPQPPSVIWLPYYTCEVMLQPLRRVGVHYEFYGIDENLEVADWPKLGKHDYIIVNNYFGIKDRYIRELSNDKGRLKHLIIDASQAWYSPEILNARQFYSPRKFFGVPDGGAAFTPVSRELMLDAGCSYKRCSHLLKRIDLGAEEGYCDFQTNDEALESAPLTAMSALTRAILGNIDQEEVCYRRRRNFETLHQALASGNRLVIPDSATFQCPMVYPYWSDDSGLRSRLISKGIFVAQYWQNVTRWATPNCIEYDLARNLVPLPCDQRYGDEDMERIISEFINE